MVIPDALSRCPSLQPVPETTKVNTIRCMMATATVTETDNDDWRFKLEDYQYSPLELEPHQPATIIPANTTVENMSSTVTRVNFVHSSKPANEERKLQFVHIERAENVLDGHADALIDHLVQQFPNTHQVLRPGCPSYQKEQRGDPELRQVIENIEDGATVKGYALSRPTDGILMKTNNQGEGRVVVPPHMEQNLLWLYHEHPLAGHPSTEKMLEAIQRTFHLPQARQKVAEWVQHCQCRRAKARMRNRAGLTLSRPIPTIFSYVVMDVVGEFPRSRAGHTHWLTLMDAYSKDLELVAMRGRTAEVVAKAILTNWVCRRGCPRVILSDNAQEFVGNVVTQLCEALHVHHTTVTAYHHPSAGLVEKVHSYAHSIMRSTSGKRISEWDRFLPFIRFSILTHELDGTGLSPFQLVYGHKPTLPGDLLVNTATLPKSLRKYYQTVQDVMQTTRDYFRTQREKKSSNSKTQARQTTASFQVTPKARVMGVGQQTIIHPT